MFFAILPPSVNFNPRAPRGARPSPPMPGRRDMSISIHVPREGHDADCGSIISARQQFQSTCPARGTTKCVHGVHCTRPFQSTCPARGTTTIQPRVTGAVSYFNPRAPRGARRVSIATANQYFRISIHVPREGHDVYRRQQQGQRGYFNPRAPRGARPTVV